MVGKQIKINEMNEIAEDLWNLTGYISEIEEIDNRVVREYYGRSSKECPDETHYRIKFDQPITKKGNLKGWKGMWLKKEYFTVIN